MTASESTPSGKCGVAWTKACPGSNVDIVETEVGGFSLMELMAGWKRIILVDSIQFDGLEPGTVVQIDAGDLHTSLRLRSVHDIDLPTALELGRRLACRCLKKSPLSASRRKTCSPSASP